METPSQLSTSFMNEAKRLFEFFSQINSYLGQANGGEPPIPPATLTLVLIAIGAGNATAAGHVSDTFAVRALPHAATIRERNVPRFCEIAPTLFPEVPGGMLEQVVAILRNDDPEFADTKEDVFAYVDCLFDLSIRRQIALKSAARVCRADLVAVCKELRSLPPAYTAALSADQ